MSPTQLCTLSLARSPSFIKHHSSLRGNRAAVYLFIETAFDSAIFLLTAYKTYSEPSPPGGHSRLRSILARDGIFYYGVIFASCLAWALMVIFAPVGILILPW